MTDLARCRHSCSRWCRVMFSKFETHRYITAHILYISSYLPVREAVKHRALFAKADLLSRLFSGRVVSLPPLLPILGTFQFQASKPLRFQSDEVVNWWDVKVVALFGMQRWFGHLQNMLFDVIRFGKSRSKTRQFRDMGKAISDSPGLGIFARNLQVAARCCRSWPLTCCSPPWICH